MIVGIRVPHHTGGSPGDDAVGRAHGVGVAVRADSGDGEVGLGDQEVSEVPCEGDGLGGGDFVEGGGGLRWVGYCDGTSWDRLRDGGGGGTVSGGRGGGRGRSGWIVGLLAGDEGGGHRDEANELVVGWPSEDT